MVMGWIFGRVVCHETSKGADLSCELDYTISFLFWILSWRYPHFVEISMFCKYYPHFVDIICILRIYPNYLDIIRILWKYTRSVYIIRISSLLSLTF